MSKKLNVSTTELKSALEGRELMKVTREGKTLQLHFAGDRVLGLHLMLRGELVSLNTGETPRFQILAFHFKGGESFALIDLQKQATPTLQPATGGRAGCPRFGKRILRKPPGQETYGHQKPS